MEAPQQKPEVVQNDNNWPLPFEVRVGEVVLGRFRYITDAQRFADTAQHAENGE
jgi:hypothetical protein